MRWVRYFNLYSFQYYTELKRFGISFEDWFGVLYRQEFNWRERDDPEAMRKG